MTDPLITAAQFLLRNLDWIRHAVGPNNGEPYAVDAFQEIGDAVSRIRVLVDPGDGPKFLGPCGAPREHQDLCGSGKADPCFADDFTAECTCWCHKGESDACTGDVYGYAGAEHGTCRTCKARVSQHDRRIWLDEQIATHLADTPIPARDIAFALRLSVDTIRTWGHTSRWDDGTVRRAAKLGTFWRDRDGRIVPWLDPDPSWPAAQRAVYTAGRGPRLHYVGDVRDLATAAAERRAQREAAKETTA